jgi:alpha-galactosidase
MREQLEQAQAGEQLGEALARIGPDGFQRFVNPGPGFLIQMDKPEAQLERLEGQPGRYRFAGTDLVALVRLEVSKRLQAVVQQVTLTNEGSQPSAAIRSIAAFHLPFEVLVKDEPLATGYGGGLTDGYYPPRAYREEAVHFGQARQWEPENPTFTRWWVGKRLFRLANDENGWSANPYLPLIIAAWNAGPAGRSGSQSQAGVWAALEWSGRWEIQFGQEKSDWRFCLRGGPRVKNMVLEPGEALQLPKVHLGVFGGPGATMEDGLNAIRRYIADAVAPDLEGRRPWPMIAYHHWFGIEEALNEKIMLKQADRAAKLGLEFFEVDAGWYGGASENFANGVGNWERVDEAKFPNGLEPLAAYAKSKGLRFGLWFEPERARRGSDWVTQHPDWYWDIGNPVNFMLDLTRRDVQDHLIEMLSTWIEKLDVRWLRWDNNHPLGPSWDFIDPTGKVQFAYVAGLYRVRASLLERFPNLNIDNCAGGGNRIDFGTLRYSATNVISDHAEDPHVCRIMQTGGARVLPANYMNSSFYVGPDDGDEAVGPLELVSRMAGSMSFSGHIANWSSRQVRRVRQHLDGYRAFRHLLMKDFYALTPYPRSAADWDVVEFVDPANKEAVVLAYRVRGEQQARRIYPKRLDPEKTYRVGDPFSARKPRMLSGKALMETGLRLSLKPESAAVLHLIPLP